MNKSLAVLIYSGIWILMVLVQTFVTSSSGDVPSVFVNPELYYSTWALDVYLILLFYLNYYVLVPKMIRRRLFLPYLGMVVVASLVGFLLPIVLYVAWQWSMPGVPTGVTPMSSIGILGAIAAMSIGLAIRSILEWVRLEQRLKECEQEVQSLRISPVSGVASMSSEISDKEVISEDLGIEAQEQEEQ